MSDLLPFVVSGLAVGAVFGLAGTGLVLTYKTSGIFNFGHGALATVAAYLFYWLHVSQGINATVAAALTIGVGGPIGGLVMELLARRLARQEATLRIVGTVGLILAVQGVASLATGPDLINVEDFLPHGEDSFAVAGVHVQGKFVVVGATALVAVGALYALFRFSRIGIAMRAVVDDPDLLDLIGTDPARVRRVAWLIGSCLAALSGVLVLPLIGLEPIALTFLVVQAFGAAAIGAFSSIPATFLGGLVIGVAADISKNYVLDVNWLTGLPSTLPFIALLVALLVLPRRRLVTATRAPARPLPQWRAPLPLRVVAGCLVTIPFLLVPSFAGTRLPVYTAALTQVILFLSLGLLVRLSGQVSLCHSTFAAIGAVAFSQFAVQLHLPWLLALAAAALVAAAVGALVAVPAIRLSGLFLALATLGFAVTVERLLYGQSFMFTPMVEGRPVPRPSFAGGDTSFYFLTFGFVVVTAILIVAVQRGRLGRLLRGMADAPLAVTTSGLSTQATKLIVFCLSAALAALSGILYASSVQVASTTDQHFSSFYSVVLLAALAVAPFVEPWYAVFIGMTALIPAYLTGPNTAYLLNVAFGVAAIGVAVGGGQRSMPATWQAVLDRIGGRRVTIRPVTAVRTAAAVGGDARPQRAEDGEGLRVVDLEVRFGGLVAVRDLSLHAPIGRITGLIGPNGAGKTTTFNACTGLVRPSRGQIRLHGSDVSRLGPAARARRGIGRTFQIMQLGESLTVLQNVALGRESGLAGANLLTQLATGRAAARATAQSAWEALDQCGITALADRPAHTLSTGERRLVELARCLAGSFDVLLLDEPSSGLDQRETVAFGELLEQVVRDRGVGVLLVEHDMSLVMSVCSYLYVLDFGELLYQGTPEEVRASPLVQAAYLGSPDVQPNQSVSEVAS